MSDDIGHHDSDFSASPLLRIDKIIIITAGFIAGDAFARNVESLNMGVGFRHQHPLDLAGLGQ